MPNKEPAMSDEKALMRRLLSYTRKAVEDYDLIQENDRVCVGLSGGKDSLALLCALAALRRFYPKKFQLSAVTVSLGFPDTDFTQVSELCRSLEVPYRIVDSQIAEILFDVRKESNPCALCANLRRGALNDAAKEMDCNVVALAHHREDIIETAMLALILLPPENMAGQSTAQYYKTLPVCGRVSDQTVSNRSEAAGSFQPLSHGQDQ
jgi:tRNA(Ile)-lysidine synthase TilS/MesJ